MLSECAPTIRHNLHELAPACSLRGVGADSDVGTGARCAPICYSHLRWCTLRSMFDRPPNGLDVWTTAQAFVRRVLGNEVGDDVSGTEGTVSLGMASESRRQRLHVVIERRFSGGMKGRALANVDELLDACARDNELVCSVHTFGRQGLVADMRAVRAADVLVGLHGAGLVNALFMRRRSTLLEVRPYGFDGGWPDSYFRRPLKLASPAKIFHLLISVASPELCSPNHGFAITSSTAVYAKRCVLPWESLRRALDVVLWWHHGAGRGGERPTRDTSSRPHQLGSRKHSMLPEERYAAGAWASKNHLAYAPFHQRQSGRSATET